MQLAVLRKLQSLADKNRQETTNQGTTISFRPQWFWDLLNPKVRQPTPNDSPDLDPASGNGADHDSKMYLKTHFVQPLPESQVSDQEQNRLYSGPNSVDSSLSTENLERLDLERLSRDFLQEGFWSMADWS